MSKISFKEEKVRLDAIYLEFSFLLAIKLS